MGAVGDVARDFVEVELHHVGDLAGPHISGVVGEPRLAAFVANVGDARRAAQPRARRRLRTGRGSAPSHA
jgi:hypothetical protein